MPTDPPARQAAPAETYVYDVFISYSSKDHVWVRGPLLHRLESHGLRVCIDVRDFQPGAPIVTEMERAVLTSRYTLVILTPDFVNSNWTEFEEVLTFTIAHGYKQRRVIPLLKAACAPPLRIQALTAVDFTDLQTHECAFARLLTAVGRTQADNTVPIPAFVPPGSRPRIHPDQRFLTIEALVDRGRALDMQLARARLSLSQLPLTDARSVHAAYITWVAECLSLLDADLRSHFQAAQLGNEVHPGVAHILTLVVQSRDPDPAVAEPAHATLRLLLWHTPIDELLSPHHELLVTARRRAFPATHAISQDLKEVIAASQRRYTNGRIDDLFITNGCESHWWLRPLTEYTRKSEQRVHGWFTAMQVYAPDRERAIVQSICTQVLRDARLSEAQRAAIQCYGDNVQATGVD